MNAIMTYSLSIFLSLPLLPLFPCSRNTSPLRSHFSSLPIFFLPLFREPSSGVITSILDSFRARSISPCSPTRLHIYPLSFSHFLPAACFCSRAQDFPQTFLFFCLHFRVLRSYHTTTEIPTAIISATAMTRKLKRRSF